MKCEVLFLTGFELGARGVGVWCSRTAVFVSSWAEFLIRRSRTMPLLRICHFMSKTRPLLIILFADSFSGSPQVHGLACPNRSTYQDIHY